MHLFFLCPCFSVAKQSETTKKRNKRSQDIMFPDEFENFKLQSTTVPTDDRFLIRVKDCKRDHFGNCKQEFQFGSKTKNRGRS